MSALHREMADLREQVAELQEENRQLREQMQPPLSFPREWGLWRADRIVLRALLARSLVTRDSLLRDVWPNPADEPELVIKSLHVRICHVRGALARIGITLRKTGQDEYYLTPEDKQRVLALAIGGQQVREAA